MIPALLISTLIFDPVANRLGGLDIEQLGAHPRSSGNRLVERRPAPPGNDHVIAKVAEAMRQRAADPAPAAGHQNGIAGHFHGGASSLVEALNPRSPRRCPHKRQRRRTPVKECDAAGRSSDRV